jgi:hypothetical protein
MYSKKLCMLLLWPGLGYVVHIFFLKMLLLLYSPMFFHDDSLGTTHGISYCEYALFPDSSNYVKVSSIPPISSRICSACEQGIFTGNVAGVRAALANLGPLSGLPGHWACWRR